MTNPVLVEVLRGDIVESMHRGSVAVFDGNGKLIFEAGDIDTPVFPRSAVKSMQALPLVESGAADRLLAAASSHFCSAERQYRFPLAYGGQRTPTAQWTATAAGAAVLGSEPVPNGAEPCDVRVTHVLFGRMVEMGVTDAANMGAAMAPEDVNLDPYIFRRAERCVLC